jgi:PAS domain S-box-containing protein
MNSQSFINESQIDGDEILHKEVFDLLINNIEDSFLLLDKDFKFVAFSATSRAAIQKFFRIRIEKGMSIFVLVAPERKEFLVNLYQEVIQGNSKTTTIPLHRGGTTIFVENNFKPLKTPAGDIVGVLVSSKDVTSKIQQDIDKAKADEALKVSEQQYKSLFENNPLPCYIFDIETLKIQEVNSAAIMHYGYSKEEFLQLTVLDLQLNDDFESRRKYIEDTMDNQSFAVNDWRHKSKDGRTIYADLRVNTILFKGRPARLVVANDVTSKLLIENALKRSNERFELAARASSEALWEWDFTTEQAYISPSYTQILGWPSEDFRKFDRWPDYLHPDDKKQTIDSYETALSNPSIEKWEQEYRYRRSDGTYVYVHDKAYIVRNAEGTPVKVIGALKNINDQKIAEEELKKSNERFRLAGRAASDAIYDWNISTNDLHWGEGLQLLFGFNPNEVTITDWAELVHPNDRKKTTDSLSETLANPSKKIWKAEYLFATAAGGYKSVLENAYIIRDAEGIATRMIGSMQDFSERKFNEQILSLERSIFELSANPDVPLEKVVTSLVDGMADLLPTAIAAVTVVNEDKSIRHLIAPGLPEAFVETLKTTRLEGRENWCGPSVYEKKTIIIENIENSDWSELKQAAAAHNIKSYWSLPIVHASGNVIGCLSIYHRDPKTPTATQSSTLERLRNILRIVIENRFALQQIKMANERFDIMMKATHDLIWDWNLETNIIYRDPVGLKKVYGFDENYPIEKIFVWLDRVHPDDRGKVKNMIDRILTAETENNFDVEYRFKRGDGTYSYVFDRGIIIRNHEGRPIRMIGAAQDVSERKRLEMELLVTELEHQKAINQATVDSQETERTEIARELHDNVNQVLTTTKLYLDLASTSPDLKDELIVKSSKNIINVINEIRQLSRSLMDPSIGDLGLIESIKDLIENINLTGKIQVSLKAGAEMESLLDKNQKLTIFRIIQEALNNSIKHSKANKVKISFKHRHKDAEVVIEDDGVGFDVNTVKKGAGLKNIQNRIYLINGKHNVQSLPGKGARLIINFPIT